MDAIPSPQEPIADRSGVMTITWYRFFKFGIATARNTGATAERPKEAPQGFVYLDTTLGKPVFRSSNGWIDATGAPV